MSLSVVITLAILGDIWHRVEVRQQQFQRSSSRCSAQVIPQPHLSEPDDSTFLVGMDDVVDELMDVEGDSLCGKWTAKPQLCFACDASAIQGQPQKSL